METHSHLKKLKHYCLSTNTVTIRGDFNGHSGIRDDQQLLNAKAISDFLLNDPMRTLITTKNLETGHSTHQLYYLTLIYHLLLSHLLTSVFIVNILFPLFDKNL